MKNQTLMIITRQTNEANSSAHCLTFKRYNKLSFIGTMFIILCSMTTLYAAKDSSTNVIENTVYLDSINGNLETPPEPYLPWIVRTMEQDKNGSLSDVNQYIKNSERSKSFEYQWSLGSEGKSIVKNEDSKEDYEFRKEFVLRRFLKVTGKKLGNQYKVYRKRFLNRREYLVSGGNPNNNEQSESSLDLDNDDSDDFDLLSEKEISGPLFLLKIKTRPLKTRVDVEVINPLVELKARANARGQVLVNMAKDVKFLRLRAEINYRVDHTTTYEGTITQRPTDSTYIKVAAISQKANFSGPNSTRSVEVGLATSF